MKTEGRCVGGKVGSDARAVIGPGGGQRAMYGVDIIDK